MSKVYTTYYSEKLHSKLKELLDAYEHEVFISAMRIPDGHIRGRHTWVVLTDYRCIVIDRLYPFTIRGQFALENIETCDFLPNPDGDGEFLNIEHPQMKNLLIQISDSKGREFANTFIEQVSKVKSIKKAAESEKERFTQI